MSPLIISTSMPYFGRTPFGNVIGGAVGFHDAQQELAEMNFIRVLPAYLSSTAF